jgi:hypothetical protein
MEILNQDNTTAKVLEIIEAIFDAKKTVRTVIVLSYRIMD